MWFCKGHLAEYHNVTRDVDSQRWRLLFTAPTISGIQNPKDWSRKPKVGFMAKSMLDWKSTEFCCSCAPLLFCPISGVTPLDLLGTSLYRSQPILRFKPRETTTLRSRCGEMHPSSNRLLGDFWLKLVADLWKWSDKKTRTQCFTRPTAKILDQMISPVQVTSGAQMFCKQERLSDFPSEPFKNPTVSSFGDLHLSTPTKCSHPERGCGRAQLNLCLQKAASWVIKARNWLDDFWDDVLICVMCVFSWRICWVRKFWGLPKYTIRPRVLGSKTHQKTVSENSWHDCGDFDSWYFYFAPWHRVGLIWLVPVTTLLLGCFHWTPVLLALLLTPLEVPKASQVEFVHVTVEVMLVCILQSFDWSTLFGTQLQKSLCNFAVLFDLISSHLRAGPFWSVVYVELGGQKSTFW